MRVSFFDNLKTSKWKDRPTGSCLKLVWPLEQHLNDPSQLSSKPILRHYGTIDAGVNHKPTLTFFPLFSNYFCCIAAN